MQKAGRQWVEEKRGGREPETAETRRRRGLSDRVVSQILALKAARQRAAGNSGMAR